MSTEHRTVWIGDCDMQGEPIKEGCLIVFAKYKGLLVFCLFSIDFLQSQRELIIPFIDGELDQQRNKAILDSLVNNISMN